jgi:two-component system CheB/CheR fusion protein
MARSVIQQTLMRSRALLGRPRIRESAEDGSQMPAEADEVAVGQERNADERIKMLNDVLQTVCAKLVVKIKELDHANSDLHNLMEVSAIPAIFIDENLLIRHFTPEIAEVCSLSAHDIGRPLLDAACWSNYRDLEDDVRRVTETGEPVEGYLEQRSGTAQYLMRILPNFCRNNSIGGATLTFLKMNTSYGEQV